MSYLFERQKREVLLTPKVPFEISLFQTVLNGLIEEKIISSTRYFDIEKYAGDEFIDVLIQQDSKFFLELLTDEQQEILIVHLFLQWKGEEALNLIETRGKESISRDVLNDRIFPYFKKNFATSNQIFFRLVKLLSTYPKFYSESYEWVFPMVRSTILSLLETTTEYAAIRDIITEFFPKWEKEIALLTVEVLEWKRDIIKHDIQLFTHPHIQEILSSLSSYLKLLDAKWVDALILWEIIEIIELTWKTLKYAKLSDIYEIKSKVRGRLCELGKFDEVEVFLEATGDIQYYKWSLLQQKFNYFLKQKKKEESQKTLHDIFQHYEFTEGNITEKVEEASRQIKWHTRLESYETLAEILLNKVLFEATFGREESAKQYMSTLADLVRRISIPCDTELIEKIQKYHNWEKDHGINRYEKRCLWHLKRRRLRVKRDIKTHMFNLGFEHLLPKTEGWRDSIQSTQTLEEKYEAKQKRREERGKQRESQIEESNKKYWENEDQRATEVVESLLSQEHNNTTNILDNFFKEYSSDFGWSIRRAWNASNILIERVPQLYPQVLNWLLSRTFTQLQIGYDHSGNIEVRGEDYPYITKFFLFWFEKELITATDVYKLAEAGKRYLQNRRGSYTESQFYEFLLFPLIKILCEAWKLQEAWQVFYSVYENKEKHSDEQVSQKILWFFYSFLKNTHWFQFLESQEFNPQLDIKQQILFYNSKIEIALASKNEEEYEINRKQLQQLFLSDAEVLLFINLLNTGTVRSHHQKKEELMSIHSSTYISERVRRRIVQVMIAQKVPDLETIHEIVGKEIPYRFARLYFQQLASTWLISSDVLPLISKDSIQHIKTIFMKHRNQFNTVVKVLKEYTSGDWFIRQKNELEEKDWEGMQTLLKYVELLNYEVFIRMKEIWYDEEKIQEYICILTELTRRGFKNYLSVFQEIRREKDSFSSEVDIYELEIAHYESKILEKFIFSVNEKAKSLNRRLLIVPNLSYGYLPVSLIYRTLLKDSNIDILFWVKVGSSESHNNEQVFIPDLFWSEIEGILNNQPIILVVDGTQHIVPRDWAWQGSRYPDAYQWYLNQIIVMNQAYEIDWGLSIERYWKSQDSIESLLSGGRIKETLKRFKEIVRKKIETPYEFWLWNTNEDVLAIRSNREEVANLGSIDVEDIKWPTVIFCNVGVEHDKLPTHLKHERYKHTPAYFDDSGKIIQFDIIHNGSKWQTINPLERVFTEKVLKSETESIPMGLHSQIKIKSA